MIRDPYRQQVSQWLHWEERWRQGDRHVCCFGAAMHSSISGWLQDPYSDFDLWYLAHLGQPWEQGQLARWVMPTPGFYHFWLQVDGQIPENLQLIYFENMQQEWAQAFQDDTPLPRLNQGPRDRQLDAGGLSRYSRWLIQQKFRWAFHHHYDPGAGDAHQGRAG